VEMDIEFTEEEIEAIRPYAAYLNLTLEEAASLLLDFGFREIVEELGADSIEDADPEEIARFLAENYLPDETGGDDA